MKKIAIIGSGISGLISAYTLQKEHQVVLYEAGNYLGGHTATVDVEVDRKEYAIDTGFIVFNNRTYPNFIKFLNQLNVQWQDTEMGFSVSGKKFEFSYSGGFADLLLTQRLNLLKPGLYKLILEILRFNKQCLELEARGLIPQHKSLDDFLLENKYSNHFRNYYLIPMVSAIWSSTYKESADFSLYFFIKFFSHHGLLTINDRPQWHVIKGGSREYVRALQKQIHLDVRLNAKVNSVKRFEDEVVVHSNGHEEKFDEIILACHSDQALKILSDATIDEKNVLSQLPYQKNQVTLHTDTSRLPRNPRSWASWNYMIKNSQESSSEWENYQVRVSYNMNILQGIKSPTTFIVSLNQDDEIEESRILRQFEYDHPVFSQATEEAKSQRHLICGKNRTHFCGAYWYSGFHEDGVRSALDVAKRFGANL